MAKKFNCYQVKSRINEFIKYELSVEEAYQFAKHCSECDDCMSELKLVILVDAFLLDEDIYNIDEYAEEEIECRFNEIIRKLYFIDMIERNMKYFIIGATALLLLSFMISIIV